MNAPDTHIARGLEGIEVDTTAVSSVDGRQGTLRYRGYPIEELAPLPFAAVAHLVVNGELPDEPTLRSFETLLARAGRPSDAEAQLIRATAGNLHPMCLLQALLAITDAASAHPDAGDLAVAARVPMWVAYILRWRATSEWPDWSDEPNLHTRMLTIMHGRTPDPDDVAALDLTQNLQLEHGFNAGTFTARVVTSTRAPFANAAAAALGALYGPLHGGADEAALRAAARCGGADNAAAFVADCLDRGERVMGMGHREYRTMDPRARLIRPLAAGYARQDTHLGELYATLEAIEAEFGRHMQQRRKSLYANVDFYKGIVYRGLDIPEAAFTAMFAASRVFGYAAHDAEQRAEGRLIRPAARYIGPPARSVAA